MDINGTRFHMLTGAGDWRAALDRTGVADAWYDPERQALTLLPELPEATGASDDPPLTPEARRGAGADHFGNLYWIDADATAVMILPAGTRDAGIWWRLSDLDEGCEVPAGDFAPVADPIPSPARLSGLAVTAEHRLVVGMREPGGLLVFDLYGGGAPEVWPWPGVPDFAPFDMAPTPEGGVWILDRPTGAARLWRLGASLGVEPLSGRLPDILPPEPDFVPEDPDTGPEGEPCLPSVPVRPEAALTLGADAVSVAGLPDGSALLLGHEGPAGPARIDRIAGNGKDAGNVLIDGPVLSRIVRSLPVRAHDMAVIAAPEPRPGRLSGTLTLALESGNQALAFGIAATPDDFDLTLRPRFLPLRRFSGKALVASGDAVLHDIGDHWFRITAMPRRRHAPEATLDSIVFDGREPGCVWHRVLMDACIPEGASLRLRTRAADDLALLPETDWSPPEPAPYRRSDGAEILNHAPYGADPADRAGTWELLLQEARGRFIEIALTLSGDGLMTPSLRALRVYYPRFSYLDRFLPAVYREEPHSASFLDRYLANVEGMFTATETRIAEVQTLFDCRTAPSDALDWLAGWLGATLDTDWGDARRRLLIDHAELLFRWRGTLIGMRAALRLATEDCPDARIFDELRSPGARMSEPSGSTRLRIVERFRYRSLPGVVLGDPTGDMAGPPTVQTTGAVADLGNPAVLSARYRSYLERRYGDEAAPGERALDALNRSWSTSLDTFSAIVFRASEPTDDAMRADWRGFVQEELVLRGAWSPAQGTYALHLRWQRFLAGRHGTIAALNASWGSDHESFSQLAFPPVRPAGTAEATDWRDFTGGPIGFTYADVGTADAGAWRLFLTRRYRRIDRLNTAHGRSGSTEYQSFDAIGLPDRLPEDETALRDWVAFVSLALPIRRNAHRFTVLVPTLPRESAETRARRIGQATAVVNREKPAHTAFETRLFWALFQVGTARLGEDTILGDSSRYVAAVLDAGHLGDALLAPSGAWTTPTRSVLGRDRPGP